VSDQPKVDYKSTVLLPKTAFPMRAQLPKREPELLSRWENLNLYRQLREDSKGCNPFILHDGPPYANGHLHIGHALNKILKDIINRCQQMLGKDANYVPGWDCHGLPIEWKIEEKYRAAGRDKDQVPLVEFRHECRQFAKHWVDVQREEFKRLGVIGDWDNPYSTMSFDAEAQIVRELGKFLMNGALFRGAKPVMWSVVERTALAEAEVEYHDHTSKTIFVRFPVLSSSVSAIDGAAVVIWTTTPWTMPGNRAIAYGDRVGYSAYRVKETGEGSLARSGEVIVVAEALADTVFEQAAVTSWESVASFTGEALEGTLCRHPFHGKGYDFEVPLLPGHFVDVETGSGFVHIAPGHGVDDWELGVRHGVPVPETVGADGVFVDQVPLFSGRRVLTENGKEGDANSAVIEALTDAGGLVARGRLVHSYPHSWRSKAPLIFRNTPQWFISMENTNLRQKPVAWDDRDTAGLVCLPTAGMGCADHGFRR
jgi:isoleucyl-tRNA synthetase